MEFPYRAVALAAFPFASISAPAHGQRQPNGPAVAAVSQAYLPRLERTLHENILRDHLWDPVHGGSWWEVDASGARSLRPEKHHYGQGFALYGLSEYCLATKNAEALELARRLFDVMERHRQRRGAAARGTLYARGNHVPLLVRWLFR